MTASFPGPDWTDALWTQLRDDEELRRAAATWVTGPLLWTITPSEGSGLDAPWSMLVDVHEGTVRGVSEADAGTLAPYALTGSYATWKQVLQGERSLYDAVLASALAFRGDLPEIARHERMFARLAGLAGTVDTAWPDEVAAEAAASQG